MILSNSIIDDIKKKSGLLFDKAGDFDILSSVIGKETGRSIGVTTLKRLFNYIDDSRKASEYTLNTIALYLGYESWAKYCSTKNIESEWNYTDEAVYIQDLEVGNQVSIEYLDRKIVFSVISHDGMKVLKVESSENSSLNIGDILVVHKIRKGDILEAKKVIRGERQGNYKTNGEIKKIEVLTRI